MNIEVSKFLDNLNHPFRKEIEALREIILHAHPDIKENIKWNGPNYILNDQDRITIKVNPPKSFHLILHTGAKVQEQPANRILKNDYGVLVWKSNDRAIANFNTANDFENASTHLGDIVKNWLQLTL